MRIAKLRFFLSYSALVNMKIKATIFCRYRPGQNIVPGAKVTRLLWE